MTILAFAFIFVMTYWEALCDADVRLGKQALLI